MRENADSTLLSRNRRRYKAVILMRPCPVVSLHEISTDVLLGQRCRLVTHRWHLLRFQATKQPLAEATAAILAALVAVKQDPKWSATRFVSPDERLGNQFGIRFGRHCPPHHSATAQVQDDSQIALSALCPDISDVAAPDLIWRSHGELAIKHIGIVGALDLGLLIRMRTRLLADQPLLLHQSSDFEPSDRDASVSEHGVASKSVWSC